MKKQIISTLLAGTMLTAATIHAQAIESAANPLDGYTVTVYDQTSPCVFAASKDWPITRWYFFDEGHNIIGSISGKDLFAISAKYPDGENWEYWFADVFNDYRGVGESVPMEKGPLHKKAEFDAAAFAQKMLDLANEERIEHGLEPVELDESMMELAQVRAEEASELYSHVRPDGTRVSRTYYYAEIINCGAQTPETAVESWMASEGHRDIILTGRYRFGGFGAYQDENGKIFCCGLYSR